MQGTIERIKNAVLFKCNNLNDNLIANELDKLINESIYHFAEEMINMIGDVDFSEEKIRIDAHDEINNLIVKKIKRKLFIDSLALQITNDLFIEDYVNEKVTLNDIKKKYLKELKNNKNSNQLNMTEDLKLDDIFAKIRMYVDLKIKPSINENSTLVENVEKLIDKTRKELEIKLKNLIDETDKKYLEVLIEEIENVIVKEEEGVEEMINDIVVETNEVKETENKINQFNGYDDMTLFNKVLLSLNTKEEKLTRRENKLAKRKEAVDEALEKTNKNIEANINRENELLKRKYVLGQKEVDINSKLSETEVIFLNLKPLIKGLSNINNGGSNNE